MPSRSSTTTDTERTAPVEPPRESRAVTRLIEAGCTADCPYCGERVKYRARHRDQQVICNVYVDGVWQRVEQYHAQCYEDAGHPHGEPI